MKRERKRRKEERRMMKEVLCHGQGHTGKAAVQISFPLHCDSTSGALHGPVQLNSGTENILL